MNKSNILTSAIVAIAVSLIVGLFGGHTSPAPLGGGNLSPILSTFYGGINVSDKNGTAGTNYKLIKNGTCTILADVSVAATSTKNFDCAFTGVQSGDLVFAHLAATSSLASQYEIKGVTASTTNGWITFSLLNLTGTSATPSNTVGVGSSTVVQIFRPFI